MRLGKFELTLDRIKLPGATVAVDVGIRLFISEANIDLHFFLLFWKLAISFWRKTYVSPRPDEDVTVIDGKPIKEMTLLELRDYVAAFAKALNQKVNA